MTQEIQLQWLYHEALCIQNLGTKKTSVLATGELGWEWESFTQPQFYNNGSMILVMDTGEGGANGASALPTTGGKPQPVALPASMVSEGWLSSVSFSLDGRTRLFVGGEPTIRAILAVEGSGEHEMPTPTSCNWGRVEPDGSRVIFGTYEDGERAQSSIYVCNIDGSGLTEIADGSEPSWIVGMKGATSKAASKSQASCYGFKYAWSLIDTRKSMYGVASKLVNDGFQGMVFYDKSARFAKSRMPQDSVFFFNGHGNVGRVVFEDESGNEERLTGADIRGIELGGMQLAVFMGCLTGKNPGDENSLLKSSTDKGAGAAIGFSVKLNCSDHPWADKFCQYLLEDHLSINDASMKAAGDIDTLWHFIQGGGITPDTTIVWGKKRYEGVRPE